MVDRGRKWHVNRAVRRSLTLPAPSRLIMFVLSDIADAGTAETPPKRTPSLTQLAAESGLSLATVKRHLTALEADGWLTRIRPTEQERVAGGRTRYRLTVPPTDPSAHGEPTDAVEVGSDGAHLDQGSAHSDTEIGSHRADPSAHGEPTSTNDQNNNHNHSSSPAAAADGSSESTRRPRKPDPLARFDDFWRVYPLKRGKPAAQKAFAKAVTTGADPQLIIDGATVYALECRTKEPRYIKYPQGWLNDGRWGDEPEHTPPPALPVAYCPVHRLELPCRGCAADAKAERDGDPDWPPPEPPADDDPYAEPDF